MERENQRMSQRNLCLEFLWLDHNKYKWIMERENQRMSKRNLCLEFLDLIITTSASDKECV